MAKIKVYTTEFVFGIPFIWGVINFTVQFGIMMLLTVLFEANPLFIILSLGISYIVMLSMFNTILNSPLN